MLSGEFAEVGSVLLKISTVQNNFLLTLIRLDGYVNFDCHERAPFRAYWLGLPVSSSL